MNNILKYIIVLLIPVFFLPSIVNADTQRIRLQTYVIQLHVLPIGFTKAPAYAVVERRGVAEYESGERATYLMRGSGRLTPKGGKLEGFSQYTFTDGSTSVVKWHAQLVKEEGNNLPTVSGKGSYISGTGRLRGIQGDVTFTGKYLTPYLKEQGLFGDMIIDAVANYTLPSQ